MNTTLASAPSRIDTQYQQAKLHFQQRRYHEAEMLCRNILQATPGHENALILLGQIAHTTGNDDTCAKIVTSLETITQNLEALNLAFAHYRKNNNIEKSKTLAHQLLQLAPSSPLVLSNVAGLWIDLKKLDTAKRLLELGLEQKNIPKNVACALLCNYAKCLYEQSNFKALEGFYQAKLKEPLFAIDFVYHIGTYAKTVNSLPLLLQLMGKLKNEHYFEHKQLIGLDICLAVLYYLSGDMNKVKQTIEKINHTYSANITFPDQRNLNVYFLYISNLLKFQQQHPSVVADHGSTDKHPLIHVLGDSHCLSTAFTLLDWQNTKYLAIPSLTVGTQARHLNPKHQHPNQALVKQKLSHLPQNANVIFMFGEIDCRMDEGILKYHRKKGTVDTIKIYQTADEIVKAYTDSIQQMSTEFHIHPILCGIPATNPKLYEETNTSKQSKELHQGLVKKFNQCLQQYAQTNGIAFIDTQNATTNEAAYVDLFHLKPNVLAQCMR